MADATPHTIHSKDMSNGRSMLHFGALVYLCFENEKKEEFITTAEGFTKNKIRLKQTSSLEKEGNFTQGLFRIFPLFFDQEYLKTKQLSDQKKREKLSKTTPFNRRAARQEIPKQIKLMEEEAQLNYDQYEKLKGTPVMFGQTIQLLHHNSNKYLQFVSNAVSDFESDNLKVSLSEEYSEETQFRILPCFSYQQESQGLIFGEDIVHIVSTIDTRNSQGDPYLHASKDIGELKDGGVSKVYKKKEMNVSTDKKSQWKIRIFSEYNDERNAILSVCDFIWINYSEKDLNLLVDKISDNEKEEKYILKFEDCESTEKYKKFVGNSNGMFMIERADMQQGGLVEWENEYRLRHLTTNQFLSLIVMGTNEVLKDDRCLVLQPDPKRASYFKFELIYSTLVSRNRDNLTKYMQKDSYFRMSVRPKSSNVHENDVFWLKTTDSDEFREAVREYQDVASVFSAEKQVYPAFSSVKKEENVFKLNKASSNEVRMTQFLLSCRKTIRKTFEFMNPNFIANSDTGSLQMKFKKFLVMASRIERCLIDLNRFCHNKLKVYLYVDQEFGTINSFIQNVLREQLFIELLVSLLATAFPKTQFLNEIITNRNNEKKNRDSEKVQGFQQEIKEEFIEKKKRIGSLIYKLLSSICKQNRKNQERSAKFLPLFSMQSKYVPGCMECLFSIIENYSELLQNQLQIEYFENNIDEVKKHEIEVKKYHTSQYEISKISQQYCQMYDSVARQLRISSQEFQLKERWDMFEFFCYQVIETQDSRIRRELLRFLGFASTDKGEGVNENQELIFNYLIHADETFMYERGYLIHINSKGSDLLLTSDSRKLVDFAKKENFSSWKRDNNNNNSGSQNPRSEEEILSYVIQQLKFFVSMCNKRNNTWKEFVDKSCKFESLASTIVEQRLTYDIRSIVCSLLNKLYVDQEPKRTQYYPELCKILQAESISGWNEQVSGELVEVLDDQQVKQKLIDYIKAKSTLIEEISNEVKVQKSSSQVASAQEQEIQQKIQKKSNEVYNLLTYEIIKMLRLLTEFGKYDIHNDISKFALQKEKFVISSGQFFEILQNVMTIFEFDKTFPEARKTLLTKRADDKLSAERQFQEQSTKTIMSIFNFAMSFVGLSFGEEKEKKKTKKSNSNLLSEEASISDNFLKQTDVLKKVMTKFFSDNHDDVEFLIKQEICEILELYLNYQQDYMLNRLKYQYSFIVTEKLNTLQKIKDAKNDPLLISTALKEFKDNIQANIDAFIPTVLLTGASEIDKKEIYTKQFQPRSLNGVIGGNSLLSGAFNPLAFVGQKNVKESKDGEVIDVNKILGFQILPSLVQLFCFTQNHMMEDKILRIMTRFYNQRQEFATLASQLLLLFDPENQKVLDYSKFIITSRLDKNVNESETWMKSLNDPNCLEILHQTTKDIKFFSDILRLGTKPEVSLGEGSAQNKGNPTRQYFTSLAEGYQEDQLNGDLIFSDRSNEDDFLDKIGQIDGIRQDIFYHNRVHILAINLIKDSIYLLEELDKKSQLEQNDGKAKQIFSQMRTLFRNCMSFLRNFVFKNPVNQDLLSEYLERLYKALPFDIGLLELYWEIFRDNERICLGYSHRISEDILSLIQVQGRQARFLEFFIIIQKANNNYLVQNQKNILSSFLNDRQKRSLLYLTPSQSIEFQFSKVHPLDEPYEYHAKAIEVLGMTTIGKEGMYMSEQKLRQEITLKYVFQLLRNPDNFNSAQEVYYGPKQEDEMSDSHSNASPPRQNKSIHQNFNKNNKVIDTVLEEEASENEASKLEKSSDKRKVLNISNRFDDEDDENNNADQLQSNRKGGQVQSLAGAAAPSSSPHADGGSNSIDPYKIKVLKVPLLKYLYFTFLESEKISDEFNKSIQDFILYIQFEANRIINLKEFSDEYYEYFHQLLFTLCAYKKAFASSLSNRGQGVGQNTALGSSDAELQKEQDHINMNKELNRLTEIIMKKNLIFMSQDAYQRAFDAKKTKMTSYQQIKYLQRWKIFKSLLDGHRIKAVKLEEEQEEHQRLIDEQLRGIQSMSILNRKKATSQKVISNKKENSNLFEGLNVFGIGKKETIELDPDNIMFHNLSKDNMILQRLWDVFLDQFLNSSTLKTQIDTEHSIFAQALESVESIFKNNPSVSEIINKNEIFKKLIQFVKKSYKDQNEIESFKLILNCLGNFILPPRPEGDKGPATEEQEEQEQEAMENNQNFLNENNATYMLLSLLSDYSNPKTNDAVFGDLINFGIKLLEEGNNDVQKSVYAYFMNFPSSEVFFKRIHGRLEEEINNLRLGITETSQDGFFYFQQSQDIVFSILRLLQLFAEGHNLDLQKYMRLQTQNYHNFDLIAIIIELLNTYFKSKSVKFINNMTQCLDTLTEYIQGPCKENQQALIQDNFLDLAQNLFGIDEIIDDINLQIKKERENNLKLDTELDEQVVDPSQKVNNRGKNKEDQEEEELLPRWEISKLKYKCSITLISLLEARSREDDIVPRMMKTLNIDIIKRNITDIYNQFIEIGKEEYNSDLFNHFDLDPDDSDRIEHKNNCSFIIETGFNLFILLSTFKEVEKDEEDLQLTKKKKKKNMDEEENLLRDNIVTELIELLLKLIQIIRKFVEKSASQVGNFMKAKQKEDLSQKKAKVKHTREVLQDKALQFFEQHTKHIEVLREDDNQLEKTYFYLPYFCQELNKDAKINFNRNANRISVKAKVTSLLGASDDLIKKMKHNYQLLKWLEKIPLLLFIKEKIALFRNLAFTLAITINIMVLISFERITNDDGTQIERNAYTERPIQVLGVVIIVLSVIVVMYFLALNAPLLIMKAWEGKKGTSIFEYLLRVYTMFMNLLSDFYVLYYIIYGLTAVVGTIASPFFFFFHLFDVLVRSPDLLNVVKAVWIPKRSILFTYFLFLVLMYVFTLFGYYWLDESYPGDFCESTFICLITALDRSFKFDGGLGGFLDQTTQKDTIGYFLIRFFFDNLYFLLLIVIMLNIVSGIIIDQFGEGREELKEYNNDLRFKCFVCGYSNEEIEKNSDSNQNFKSHIKEDHYMWNYLFYIAYLKDKTPTEYTGIESYVADKLDKKEITWFPTNRAMCMSKSVEVEHNHEVLLSLQEVTQSIRKTLESVNSTLDKFNSSLSSGQFQKQQGR